MLKSRNQQANNSADSFISEYLGIDQKLPQQQHNLPFRGPQQQQQPRTFQMEKLLNELKQIDTDNATIGQHLTPSSNNQMQYNSNFFKLVS